MRRRTAAIMAAALFTLFCAGSAHAGPTTIRGSIVSWDATKIVYNLFLPDEALTPAPWPIIFMTHGWGGSGATGTGGTVGTLLNEGYAVITWDSRGFGQSGGEANVDDPGHEGRDLSALIDLVAQRPDILKDAPNDPRMGMIGGSYAGGIQLAGAAFDGRVDAIVPQITWNDLRYSLFPNGVVKLGFDQGLYATGLATAVSGGLTPSGTAGVQPGAYAPEIHRAEVLGLILGQADQETLDWFKGRSLAGYGFGHPVRVPTLIQQGNTDALFNVNEAIANFDHVRANGAPVKLMVFCGGHVGCPSNYVTTGMNDHLTAQAVAWFARYVKGDTGVDTGAPVEYFNNDGTWHTATDFTTAATASSVASGSGTIVNTGLKTSVVGSSAGVTYATPSGSGDPGTLTFPTDLAGGDEIVGIPSVTLTVSGTGVGTHLFVKFVDREANQVIDLQETAVRVEDLSTPQTLTLDMVAINYAVPAGHHVDVQVSTSSGAMLEYRGAAVVDVAASVTIPLR